MKLIKALLITFTVALIAYISLYFYAYLRKEPLIQKNINYLMYDDNDVLFNSNDEEVKYDKISKHLINATIATEDKNFFKHFGFDYLRIAKAFFINIKNGENAQGASTITQQYAKNLFLSFEKTWKRKFDEAWLTIQIESHYTKKEIIEGYLNTINYGGVFGIQNASYYYFGKKPEELTLAESSILAGIPKSPSNYSPITNYDNAKKRQKIILQLMVNNKYISQQEADEAYNQELNLIGKIEKNNSRTILYYQDAVLKELKKLTNLPGSVLKNGGLKIFTNLDVQAQLNLEESLMTNISDNQIQYTSVLTESKTGAVKALIGGKDYGTSQYNRATDSKRQVGSTLKPFLYYSALENGFTASSTFNSSKTTFVFADNKTYSPSNYGEVYGEKDITMAAALAYSDNIYAVKTHLFLGEDNLVSMLKRIGIDDKLVANPSLALGTSEINIMEMIEAYGTFASGGLKTNPYLIRKIEDNNGNILYEHKQVQEELLNTSLVYIMNELLNNCYSSNFISYNYPTCINVSSKLKNKYAIKTGTTDTDSIIFGYDSEYLLGMWAGYDDNKNVGPEISVGLKNAWADAINKTTKNSWYEMPTNVVGSLVDPITGDVNGDKKSLLYYLKGTEPAVEKSKLDDLIPTIKENAE